MRTITATRGERLVNTAPLSIGLTLVGRDTDVGLFLDHPGISRHHCEIRFDGRHMTVRALVDGVMVNARRLAAGEQVRFELNEWIAIGPFVLTVTSKLARSTVDTVPMDAPAPGVWADTHGLSQRWAVATFEAGPRTGERVILDASICHLGGPRCALELGQPYPVAHVFIEYGRAILVPPAVPGAATVFLDGRPLRTVIPVLDSDLITVADHAFRITSEPVWTPTLPAETVGGMIGNSPAMRQVFGAARRFAAVDDENVLIGGPSGTGKELLARAIHDLSPRAKGPYIPINCAELGENLMESVLFGHAKGAFTGATHARAGAFRDAEHGTILLDEFGTLPVTLQAKLLRALADRSVRRVGESRSEVVDTRIILATNVDLVSAVREGTFREDLLYRICALVITMPPLTSRIDDIPLLARWFLAQRFPGVSLTDAALTRLLDHPWPGNVRELFQVLTGAAVEVRDQGRVIRPEHLPFVEEVFEKARLALAPPPPFDEDVRTLVPKSPSEFTPEEWAATDGSERERADRFGLTRGGIRYWDKRHGAAAATGVAPPSRRKKKRIPELEVAAEEDPSEV